MNDEEKSSRRYYESQLSGIDYHSKYPPRIKIQGESETKWMDLNPISAEMVVKKLIEQFNLTIK
jgi:hypothetical protein